jgi:hypothetical protein
LRPGPFMRRRAAKHRVCPHNLLYLQKEQGNREIGSGEFAFEHSRHCQRVRKMI